MLRKLFFWTHLVVGIVAGGLILLMSVTGVMLGFERQMIAWLDGAPRVTATVEGALPLDTLLARAGIERADVASVLIRRDASQPVTVRFRERGTPPRMLDPYRGDVVERSGDGSAQAFFSGLRRWHRWIGAQGGELRAAMRNVNGTANLLFLLLVLSGIYLWWPRRWTRARLGATAVPRLRHSGRARDYNWHTSFGFWAAIPLALIVASGVFISFQWPDRWLDLALGSPVERAAARGETETVRTVSAAAVLAGSVGPDAALADYVARAAAARPAWTQLTLTLPEASAPSLRVAVAEGNGYRPDLRSTLSVDRTSATVVEATGYADLSPSRKIRAWVRFGHTGEVFGITGQLIATIASAAGALLVWTGFALAWRRLQQWRRRRRRAAAA